MRRYGYLLVVAISLFWNCNSPQAPSDNIAKNLPLQPKDNYIVLMDLGDRILFNNQQQVAADIEMIKSIGNIFKANLSSKDSTNLYYTVGDRLKLLGAPNWFYASVDLAAEQPEKRAAAADKMEKTFATLLPEIYKGVITANDDSAYSGAGIWEYFNEHLSDDLDKDGQNTLFIITDGYMSSKQKENHPAQENRFITAAQVIDSLKFYPDWETRFTKGDYGLPTISKKFSNLKVIVLQLNPKEGWKDEYMLLTKIWDKWFTEMGISNYTLIKQDSNSSIAKGSLARAMNIKIDTTSATEQWTKIKPTTDSFLIKMIAAEKKAAEILKKSAAASTSDPSKNDDTHAASPPVTTTTTPRENTASNTVPPPAAAPDRPKATDAPKKKTTPEVLPPDESDTRLLNLKKPDKAATKKTGTKNNDDILQDDAASNGFNTGIKKDTKKKNQ